MSPAAIEKAESLYRFASSQGAPLSTFELVLSDAEGLDLVDWLLEQNAPNELLALDVERAHLSRNPWEVLQNFHLLGFSMISAAALH